MNKEAAYRRRGANRNALLIVALALTAVVSLPLGGTTLAQGTDQARVQPALVRTTVQVPAAFASSYGGPRSVLLPAGFSISVYASGVTKARFMTAGACGDIFAGTMDGNVYRLPDRNKDGVADSVSLFASGLPTAAHSVEYFGGQYYVATGTALYRFDQADCNSAASNGTVLVNLPSTGRHFTRTVLHSPDGKYIYISVGSTCNECVESDSRYASVLRYNADGSGGEIYASGLRNAVGLAFKPGSDELWATDNGSDYLGDNTPYDEIDLVQEGHYYGWPYCYNFGTRDTRVGAPPAGKSCAGSTNPLVTMQAHSAPLGIAFSTNTDLAFPSRWKEGFFVAFHGSFNRSVATGYKVVYIPAFAPGGGGNPPTIDFATAGTSWRPAGLLVGPDNALYVSADTGNTIYRISYSG